MTALTVTPHSVRSATASSEIPHRRSARAAAARTAALAVAFVGIVAVGCSKRDADGKGVVLAPPGATHHSTLPAGVDLADVKIDPDILTPVEEATVPASSGAIGAGEPIEPFLATEALSLDKALAEAIGELG